MALEEANPGVLSACCGLITPRIRLSLIGNNNRRNRRSRHRADNRRTYMLAAVERMIKRPYGKIIHVVHLRSRIFASAIPLHLHL
jgi:hypothetical protein